MIEYEWIDENRIAVFLTNWSNKNSRTRVGKILKVKGGFQYYPKGGRPGEILPTFDDCKKSLEEE